MWLVVPPSCPCVPESAVSTSPSDECFQRLASSVLSRSKPSPARSWRHRWQKASWMRHLSGLTSKHSTVERGVAAWISSLRDSRASRSVSPGSSAAVKTTGTYGRTSVGLSTGRGRLLSFSKTSPACSLFDSLTDAPPTKSSDPSYSAWLTELRRSSLQRRKSAPRTSGNGCSSSLWPTASTEGGAGEISDQLVRRGAKLVNATTGRVLQTNLATEAKMWPTTTVGDSFGAGSRNTPGSKAHKGVSLSDLVQTGDSMGRQWATPTSSDSGEKVTQAQGKCLVREAFQFGPQPPATPQDGLRSSPSGPTSPRRLNPRFVEWLMGFPSGWTNCVPTATPLCQPKAPTPFDCSYNYTGGGEA